MTTSPHEATPAITSLPCGCFFSGRQFFACDGCEEHKEEEDRDDEGVKTDA